MWYSTSGWIFVIKWSALYLLKCFLFQLEPRNTDFAPLNDFSFQLFSSKCLNRGTETMEAACPTDCTVCTRTHTCKWHLFMARAWMTPWKYFLLIRIDRTTCSCFFWLILKHQSLFSWTHAIVIKLIYECDTNISSWSLLVRLRWSLLDRLPRFFGRAQTWNCSLYKTGYSDGIIKRVEPFESAWLV